ncbi:MAG: putative bifunctional diguanylate cyclase/phosphodiesterase, partial [Geminicoccales bacterium]
RSMATPTRLEDGTVVWDGLSLDVTLLVRTEQALRESEERYRRLVEAAPDAILTHQDGRITFVNAKAAELLGAPAPEALIGRDSAALLDPDATAAAWLTRRTSEPVEHRLRRLDGRPVDVEITSVQVTEGGRPALQSVIRDITRRRRAAENEERYRRLVETAPAAILTYRASGITFANARALELLQASSLAELRGRPPASFVHPDDVPLLEISCERLEQPANAIVEPSEIRIIRLDGRPVDVEMTCVPITEEGEAAVQVVLLDITERKRAQERIRHLAHHDALTGLPNRVLLLDRLNQALAHARRDGARVAVLMLDLDAFKDVNDTLGHPVGDQLLCAVAERLRGTIRQSDTLARFGGDEFVLVQAGLPDRSGALMLAHKIIDSLARPFVVEGQEVHTTTSIGVALFPEHGERPDRLLKNADLALYRAKARGRNGFELYVDEMQAVVHARKALENDLRRAAERNQLSLLYQPQLDLRSDRLAGVEALLRWRHPRRGAVAPRQFVPLAEASGLIRPIGAWILEEACRQARRWMRAGTPVRVGVNLSAGQCREAGFVDLVARLLVRHQLEPALLELEITESLLMDPSSEDVAATLRILADNGVQLSIDDFGTGYSSLAYLKRFPVHRIKLDRSFVSGIGRDSEDEAIVRAVLGLGRSLGKEI